MKERFFSMLSRDFVYVDELEFIHQKYLSSSEEEKQHQIEFFKEYTSGLYWELYHLYEEIKESADKNGIWISTLSIPGKKRLIRLKRIMAELYLVETLLDYIQYDIENIFYSVFPNTKIVFNDIETNIYKKYDITNVYISEGFIFYLSIIAFANNGLGIAIILNYIFGFYTLKRYFKKGKYVWAYRLSRHLYIGPIIILLLLSMFFLERIFYK